MTDMFVAKQMLSSDICGHPDCFNRKGAGNKIAVVQNLGPIIRTPHGNTHTKCFFRHLASSDDSSAELAVEAVEGGSDE